MTKHNLDLELQIIEVSYKNLKKFENLLNICKEPNSMKIQISDVNNTVEADYCSLFNNLLIKDVCKLIKGDAVNVVNTSRRNIIDSCNNIINMVKNEKNN